MSMHILLLEDDLSLSRGIKLKLEREGYTVARAGSLAEAALLRDISFQLAILDISLPDGSGLTMCEALRKRQPHCHILLLTAMDTETDIVTGYDLGADDYVTKPFSLSVLLSKIQAVQRRLETELPIDRDLTRNERKLLAAFRSNPGQVLTKEQLLHTLWDMNGDFVDENTLAVNIQRLRAKIEKDPKNPRNIINVRGVGYRYEPHA